MQRGAELGHPLLLALIAVRFSDARARNQRQRLKLTAPVALFEFFSAAIYSL